MVFDTGVLLALAAGSPFSEKAKEGVLDGSLLPVTGELNLAELEYVICRRLGSKEASRVVGLLRRSDQFAMIPPSEFVEGAARMKCSRSLSLVDCFTLTMAETMGIPALFASHEKELDREAIKSPFSTKLLFLEDLWSGERPGKRS